MGFQAVDWIGHHAVSTPNKTAVIELPGHRTQSYAQMHERVARLSGVLKEKGIQKGDRVAFLTLNSIDTLEIIFACWRVGAVCLALNFRLTPPELKFILDNSETDMVIVDIPFAGLADALKPTTKVKHWIGTNGMGGDSEYETALSKATPIYEMVPQDMEDQCMLMYSSGTTGTPKGVIITHGMLAFTAAGGSGPGRNTPDGISLSNMPLFHIGGLNVTALPAMFIGATTVIMRMFDPEATLDAIHSEALGITTLFMVPAAYNAMKAHPKCQDTDFSRIQTALCGAETVPVSLVKYWMSRGVIIQEGYGMTETAAAGCMLDKADIPDKIGSAGKALIYSTIKIVDETGAECAPNVSGEILFKGPSVTPGYWRRPDANAESFVDGWFKSGDIGRKDADGFIYIEDRIKDMYISGGENVYPAEIENLLYQLPQIVEVAVIGVPDEKFGETGCVCAVIKAGESLSLKDVIAHVSESLARYKQPQYLHVMDVLPRNATGKVLKFELRKTVPDLLGLVKVD